MINKFIKNLIIKLKKNRIAKKNVYNKIYKLNVIHGNNIIIDDNILYEFQGIERWFLIQALYDCIYNPPIKYSYEMHIAMNDEQKTIARINAKNKREKTKKILVEKYGKKIITLDKISGTKYRCGNKCKKLIAHYNLK